MILKNDLFLRAAKGEMTERPPVWLMRQAGRILPEYRAVRAQLRDFKELVETPERAAEVTIQPIDILGTDAAIIFSDILVIPEALGLPYLMVESKGPAFPKTIQTSQDIENLADAATAASRLGYVYEALRITKRELDGRVPLIGFAGAPWTLLAYMVEGGGSKTFSKAKKFLYTEPVMAHALLRKITDATIAYLQGQVAAGADVLQIFDSWAGILSPEQYRTFSLPYIKEICAALPDVPKTVFAKDAWFALADIANCDCTVVGLDWCTDPRYARQLVGTKVLQGNLDPCCLYAAPSVIAQETKAMIQAFGTGKHIVNLGHGVYPDTPLDGVRAFIDTVKGSYY